MFTSAPGCDVYVAPRSNASLPGNDSRARNLRGFFIGKVDVKCPDASRQRRNASADELPGALVRFAGYRSLPALGGFFGCDFHSQLGRHTRFFYCFNHTTRIVIKSCFADLDRVSSSECSNIRWQLRGFGTSPSAPPINRYNHFFY